MPHASQILKRYYLALVYPYEKKYFANTTPMQEDPSQPWVVDEQLPLPGTTSVSATSKPGGSKGGGSHKASAAAADSSAEEEEEEEEGDETDVMDAGASAAAAEDGRPRRGRGGGRGRGRGRGRGAGQSKKGKRATVGEGADTNGWWLVFVVCLSLVWLVAYP